MQFNQLPMNYIMQGGTGQQQQQQQMQLQQQPMTPQPMQQQQPDVSQLNQPLTPQHHANQMLPNINPFPLQQLPQFQNMQVQRQPIIVVVPYPSASNSFMPSSASNFSTNVQNLAGNTQTLQSSTLNNSFQGSSAATLLQSQSFPMLMSLSQAMNTAGAVNSGMNPSPRPQNSLQSIPNQTPELSMASYGYMSTSSCEDHGDSMDRLTKAYEKIKVLRPITAGHRQRAEVMHLPISMCEDMVAVLTRMPAMMMDMCANERGTLLASLIERLGPDRTTGIVQFALDNFMILAKDRNGCIALPLMMEHLGRAQLDAFLAIAAPHIGSLVVHPFGNYIVKQLVCSPSENHYADLVLRTYFLPDLKRISSNKYGSHVLENTISNISMDSLLILCNTIFSDLSVLRSFLFDSYANYCVKRCLQVASVCNPTLHQWCSQQASQVLMGSPYQKSVSKHLAGNTQTQ